MTDLGILLGTLQPYAVPIGVGIGVLGMLVGAMAYPVYERILKKERVRIAPQMLLLSEELLR